LWWDGSLDRAAALLSFRARAAIAAAFAFATVTPATAATPAPALAAVFAFATAFAAILTALIRLTTFAWTLLIARTAVFAAVTPMASATASAATAMATVTLVGVTACLSTRAALGRRGCFGCAAKKAFQPADETARFFHGLVARPAILIRLLWARLEFPFVSSWLSRFEAAGITGISRLPRFVRATFASPFTRTPFSSNVTTAFAATLAPLARRLERATLVGALAGFASGRSGRAVGFPPQRRAPGVFRRQDVELGFPFGFGRR
jgi:hypothetical protein